jgi:hypothetical protein
MPVKIKKLSKKIITYKKRFSKKKVYIKHNKNKNSKQKRVKGGRSIKKKFRQEEEQYFPEGHDINNVELDNYHNDQEGYPEAVEKLYNEETAQRREISEKQRKERVEGIMTELTGLKQYFSDKYLVSPLDTTFRSAAERNSYLNRYRMDLNRTKSRLNTKIRELGISQDTISEFIYIFSWIADVDDIEDEEVEHNILHYDDLFREMEDSPNLYQSEISDNENIISIIKLIRSISALKNAIHELES